MHGVHGRPDSRHGRPRRGRTERDAMTRPLSAISADLTALAAELAAAVAAQARPTTITTAADFAQALARGGPITVEPGTYVGNFVIGQPTALTLDGAILMPQDPLSPTLLVTANDVTVTLGTIWSGAPDRDTVIVGDFNATSADQQPHRVTFDRVRVQAGTGGHRAFALHGADLTVRNCTVLGFWEKGRDSQAIWIHNGPGPYTIENNYLEASG